MSVITDFFYAVWLDTLTYFSKSLNFGTTLVPGQFIVWAIIISFAICAVVSLFNKIFIGRLVNFLIKGKAESPETALSPEGKVKFNIFIRQALKSKGVFTKIVRTEDTAVSEPEKRRYYILPADTFRAQNLYSRNGANIFTFVVTIVLLIILAAVAYKILPKLLDMAWELKNTFKGA